MEPPQGRAARRAGFGVTRTSTPDQPRAIYLYSDHTRFRAILRNERDCANYDSMDG